MAKKSIILFFLVFGSTFCYAQKVIQKKFPSEEISEFSITDNAIFKIEIQSSEESTITVSAHISGEHAENIIIEEKIVDGTLFLKTGFAPFFTFENDKLAAHKIMAIELKITVPKTIAVEIKSKLASVNFNGNIKNLRINLENGNCTLTNFSGNAQLKTIGGNITAQTQKNVSGNAISKNGTVENNLSSKGKFLIAAESINGSISLLQTK